jgi:phage protein D
VIANGQLLSGVYELEINSNAYLGADRFSFHSTMDGSNTLIWPSLPIEITISVGLDGTWYSLISGHADTIEIDPVSRSVCVSGRDATAIFISTQTSESFENLTSSDVAGMLAQRHGLTASVTPTTTLIGRFYQDGHTRSALSQHGRATTEWDLLCWLAQIEGYEVWVAGNVLNFQPPVALQNSFNISPDLCISMQLARDLEIGLGIIVEVQSWNSATRMVITQQASYGAEPAAGQKMIALRPNLSTAEALSLAQRTVAVAASHERTLTYEIPADFATMPRANLTLQGTDTDFDGEYVIFEVERRYSTRHGFTQQVLARQSTWTNS